MLKGDYEAYVVDYEENGAEYLADCLAQEAEDREASGDNTIDYGCEEQAPGTLEEWIGGMDDLRPEIDSLLNGLTSIFLLVSLLLGASATAAEYSHRTMGTWLTFEPRRSLVYLSKVTAVAIASLPAVVLGLVLAALGIFAVYQLNGLPTSLPTAQWLSLLWQGLRLIVLSTGAAAFGAALGTLLRRTSLVLGLVLVYTLVGETLIGGILPALTPALLGTNINAFVQNGATWITYDCTGQGGCREIEHLLPLGQASVYLGVLIALVLIVAWVIFRRRDVE